MNANQVQAAFEAGIKLGALYHQWVGTPISPATAATVEQAIEQAVALQPFVTGISVRIDTDRMVANSFGYSELSGLMYDVTLETTVGDAVCTATLSAEDGYPMMKVAAIR